MTIQMTTDIDYTAFPEYKLGYLQGAIKTAIIRLQYFPITNDKYVQQRVDDIRKELEAALLEVGYV